MDASLDNNWIENEFKQINCNDTRLNRRFIKVAQSMMASPSDNIHQAMEDWTESKGAYRLFDNENLQREEIIFTHAQNTLYRANSTEKKEILLAIQDATTVNYTHHPKKKGLKNLHQQESYANSMKGFHLHNVLLMTESGLPLGMLRQEVFQNEGSLVHHKQRPIEDKKSYHWLQGLQATAEIQERTIIHICDREADIYEFFMEAEKLNQYYIIRASKDRRLATGPETLRTVMNAEHVSGEVEITVPGNGKRKERKAILKIRYKQVKLKAPQRALAAQREPLKDLEVYVIFALECNPPGDYEALDWVLLSNYPVASFEESLQCLKRYRFRWNIEEYHKILKSGCNIEECQLQTFERVNKFIALMSVIAFRLFFMTLVNRVCPDDSCVVILKKHEWEALCLSTTKTLPVEPPTVREAVRMIAKLGGFLGRNSDGEPGITVIWRGWDKLQTIAEFYFSTRDNKEIEKRYG